MRAALDNSRRLEVRPDDLGTDKACQSGMPGNIFAALTNNLSFWGVSMRTIKTIGITSVLAVLLGVSGCDQSKAELDSTKQQLQTVTTERDNLKSQLDAANQQLTTLRQQLADAQAKDAAAAAPPPAAEPAKEEHQKKGGKKSAAAAPAAPAAPAGASTGPATESRTGRGHF